MNEYGSTLAYTGGGPIGAYVITGSWLVGIGVALVAASFLAVRVGFRRGKASGHK